MMAVVAEAAVVVAPAAVAAVVAVVVVAVAVAVAVVVAVAVERTHHNEMPARTPLRCSSAFPMGEVRGGARRSTSPTCVRTLLI